MFRLAICSLIVIFIASPLTAADRRDKTEVLAEWYSALRKPHKDEIAKQKKVIEFNERNTEAPKKIAIAEAKLKELEKDLVGMMGMGYNAAELADNIDLGPCRFEKAPLLTVTDDFVIFKNTIGNKTFTIKAIGERQSKVAKGDKIEVTGFFEVVERPKGAQKLLIVKTLKFTPEEIEWAKKLADKLETKEK